jgi:DNA mismatch repair ATPase MutL
MLDSVTSMFGSKLKDSLMDLHLETDEITMDGMISKAVQGCGLSSTDRQFLFVNKRPIDFPKMQKVINEVYKSYNMHQYPVYILNMTLPSDEYDVNVTPDKRQVMFHKEKRLVEDVKDRLRVLFEPTRYTLPVSAPARDASGRSQDTTLPALLQGPDAQADDNEPAADGDDGPELASQLSSAGQPTPAPEEDPDLEEESGPAASQMRARIPGLVAARSSAGATPAAKPAGGRAGKEGRQGGGREKARDAQPRISAFLGSGRPHRGDAEDAAAMEHSEEEEEQEVEEREPAAARSRRRRRGEEQDDAADRDEAGGEAREDEEEAEGVGSVPTPKKARLSAAAAGGAEGSRPGRSDYSRTVARELEASDRSSLGEEAGVCVCVCVISTHTRVCVRARALVVMLVRA